MKCTEKYHAWVSLISSHYWPILDNKDRSKIHKHTRQELHFNFFLPPTPSGIKDQLLSSVFWRTRGYYRHVRHQAVVDDIGLVVDANNPAQCHSHVASFNCTSSCAFASPGSSSFDEIRAISATRPHLSEYSGISCSLRLG